MSDAIRVMTAEGFAVDQKVIAKIKAQVNYDLIKQNKYDKFGDGDYISVETVTNILNETFGYTWSWEVIQFFDKQDYVVCHGRLTVPGLGVRDGIGQAKADKKDNSTMYSSAASFAFKSAAKRIGIAANIFNKDGMGFDVFEPGTVNLPSLPNVAYASTPASQVDMAEQEVAVTSQKPQVQSQKQIPGTVKEKAAELKEAYGIATKTQFVAFAQIWNPQITAFDQITPEVIEQLHAYAEDNGVEFEDFVASDY